MNNEQILNTVINLLKTIDFTKKEVTHMANTKWEYKCIEGQSNNSIKDRIKVARGLLMDIARRVK